MFKYIYVYIISKLTFLNKTKYKILPNDVKSVHLTKAATSQVNKIDRLQDIANFKIHTIDAVVRSFIKEYSDNMPLVKEVKLMMGYLFDIVEDDFKFGNGALRHRLTKIDDYIFSQHRKNLNLKTNIDKLRVIANSKRFNDNPRDNLIAYLVFIEEMDFEIMLILSDFYGILEMGCNNSLILDDRYKIKPHQNNPSCLSQAEASEQSFLINDEVTKF